MSFKIQISGADLPAGVKLKTQTLDITHAENGSRSVLKCTLIDITGTHEVNAGAPITIIEDGVTIWGGYCEGPGIRKANNLINIKEIVANDYHVLTDRHFVNESYARQPAGDIVQDIITNYLAVDGITAGDIEDGPDIGIINVPYYPASQVLNEIADLIGFTWRINADKTLDFVSRAYTIGPAVTASSDFLFSSLRVFKDISDYRNKQILRNIPSTTIQLTETANPSPDGVVKTFYVRYPLASKPTVEINTAGGGWVAVAAADVGILGVDTGKKWYWNKGVNSFTQDDSEAELAIGDYVRLVYYGQYILTVEMEDTEEIIAQKAIEGNSGIYEDVQDAPELDDATSATEKAMALLRRFGKVATKINLSSYTLDFEMGQICAVTLPYFGIDGEYLVMGRTIRDTGLGLLRTVVLIDGETLGGWVNFFRSWLENTAAFSIRENELIRKIQLGKEIYEWEGTLEITRYECSYPAEDSFPADDSYPGDIIEVVTLSDAI